MKPRTMLSATVTLPNINAEYLQSVRMAGVSIEQIKSEYLDMIEASLKITVTKKWENGVLVLDTKS